MNRIVTIVIGVLVLLGIFAAAIYFLDSPTTSRVESKNKIETVKKTTPSIKRQLEDHETRIKKGEKKDREQDFRLDKHANAISDLESRLNGLITDSSFVPSDSTSIKTGKKIRKYTKGWDFKDFPENW